MVGQSVWMGGGLLVASLVIGRCASRTHEVEHRYQPECDCEMFGVEHDINVIGNLGPDGEVLVPRGNQLIEYDVDGTTYRYAVVSRGAGAARALHLPVPEVVPGFAFVPGGDVPIGDDPATTIHLEPYLIAITETEPLPYDKALDHARTNHAPLPTAAEGEWAAPL